MSKAEDNLAGIHVLKPTEKLIISAPEGFGQKELENIHALFANKLNRIFVIHSSFSIYVVDDDTKIELQKASNEHTTDARSPTEDIT